MSLYATQDNKIGVFRYSAVLNAKMDFNPLMGSMQSWSRDTKLGETTMTIQYNIGWTSGVTIEQYVKFYAYN